MPLATCSKMRVLLGIMMVIGIACCIAGGIIYHQFPSIVRNKIREGLQLREGAESFKKWVDPPVPIYWKFYFFNITNPDEIAKNMKPELQEVGPYTFRVQMKKKNIKWKKDKSGNAIQYDLIRTYYHESGNLNDQIYHLNMLYTILADTAAGEDGSDLSLFFRKADRTKLEEMRKNKTLSLVEKHSINEVLFKGYNSKLLHQVKQMGGLIQMLKLKYPNDDFFGLTVGRNGTTDNTFMINAGQEDIQNLGKIIEFNHQRKIQSWNDDPYCTMINGTDASMFSPGLTRHKKIFAFSSELHISTSFEFKKEVVIRGITAFKYMISDSSVKKTKCLCNDICYGGVLKWIPDPMRDRNSIKMIFSSPHFYRVGEDFPNYVNGLKPEKEKHESYLYVEPITGITVKAVKRLQMNAHVRNIDLPLLKDMEERIIPMLWVEESAEIDEALAAEFKSTVLTPIIVGPRIILAVVAIGLLLIVLSTIIFIYKKQKNKEKKITEAPTKLNTLT